jgi:hypothetical protein
MATELRTLRLAALIALSYPIAMAIILSTQLDSEPPESKCRSEPPSTQTS